MKSSVPLKVNSRAHWPACRKVEETDRIDVSLPGRVTAKGSLHPITQIANRICSIFSQMGFDIVEGPEIETDYYNFEALNIPKNHPARDMQDTFYISDNVVLRTHTSPTQPRVMETRSATRANHRAGESVPL
jgi:phenylalanyl-tRNA synthetase alpha chain